ncbi:hypothetical protein [Devosia sp.]|uniref:hypothetical protein n=1 Tax=Devosia sp. TaxID=1871048 RepID=UPI003F6FA557
MKALLIGGVFVALSCSFSHAEDTANTKALACPMWGDLAERVMTLRQSETPMSEQMRLVSTSEGPVKKLGEALIMMAYEEPAYRTDENQKNAVAQFRNKAELVCYKGGE